MTWFKTVLVHYSPNLSQAYQKNIVLSIPDKIILARIAFLLTAVFKLIKNIVAVVPEIANPVGVLGDPHTHHLWNCYFTVSLQMCKYSFFLAFPHGYPPFLYDVLSTDYLDKYSHISSNPANTH
jgi:hypothetical protein